MLNRVAAKKRLAELADEIKAKTADFEAGRISDKNYFKKFVNNSYAEASELQDQLKAYDQAGRFAGAADMSTGGKAIGAWGDGASVNQIPGSGGYVHLPRPADATPAQWKALADAMTSGTGFRTQVQPRPAQ